MAVIMKFPVLFCAVAFFTIIGLFQSHVEAQGARFCGRRLVHVLQKVCKHKIPNTAAVFNIDKKQSFSDSVVFSPASGVVEKCCHRICSYETLVSFCGDLSAYTLYTNHEDNFDETVDTKEYSKLDKPVWDISQLVEDRPETQKPQKLRSVLHLLRQNLSGRASTSEDQSR